MTERRLRDILAEINAQIDAMMVHSNLGSRTLEPGPQNPEHEKPEFESHLFALVSCTAGQGS